LNGLGIRHLAVTFGKALAASLVAFLVAHLVTRSTLPPLVQCALGAIGGAVAYLLLAALLRMEEFWSIARFLVGAGSIGQRLTINMHRRWPFLAGNRKAQG
jgi:hypothetical protein